MREFTSRYGYPVLGLLVLLACTALFLETRKSAGTPTSAGNPELAFFVDETTSEETVLAADRVPPLVGKGGTESVVLAVKFRSDTETEAQTWYLVKFSPAVRDRAQSLAKDDPERKKLLESSRLVRSADCGSGWVPASHPEGEKVMTVPESSPGHPRRVVFPDHM